MSITILPTIDGIHTGADVIPYDQASRADIQAALTNLPRWAKGGVLGKLCRAALAHQPATVAELQARDATERRRIAAYAESDLNRTGVAHEQAAEGLRRLRSRIAAMQAEIATAERSRLPGWNQAIWGVRQRLWQAEAELPAAERRAAEAEKAFLAAHAVADREHVRMLEGWVR